MVHVGGGGASSEKLLKGTFFIFPSMFARKLGISEPRCHTKNWNDDNYQFSFITPYGKMVSHPSGNRVSRF